MVLKKYGKWFLKMCGNPAYFSLETNLVTFFVPLKLSAHTLAHT